MPGRINQVELIGLPATCECHGDSTCLDGDSSLPFEFQIIQQLLFHFTPSDGSSVFQKPVSKRAFAVIDVCNDTEVADVV